MYGFDCDCLKGKIDYYEATKEKQSHLMLPECILFRDMDPNLARSEYLMLFKQVSSCRFPRFISTKSKGDTEISGEETSRDATYTSSDGESASRLGRDDNLAGSGSTAGILGVVMAASVSLNIRATLRLGFSDSQSTSEPSP